MRSFLFGSGYAGLGTQTGTDQAPLGDLHAFPVPLVLRSTIGHLLGFMVACTSCRIVDMLGHPEGQTGTFGSTNDQLNRTKPIMGNGRFRRQMITTDRALLGIMVDGFVDDELFGAPESLCAQLLPRFVLALW